MEKKRFGGRQEGAGRPQKAADVKQVPSSFGASKSCLARIERLCVTYTKIGANGKERRSSKGEAICALSRLAEMYPDDYKKLLSEPCD